jgi:uncharacterized repeat protein (TIGR01451 family)
MKLRWILLIGVAALAGGCATPNLERIATVQSRAEALYAYGGVATFPVSSELVEVSVYAPVHHQREYQPYPIEREKVKPVVNKQPSKPAVAEQPTKPAVIEQPSKPAVAEQPAKPAVAEQPTAPASAKPEVSEEQSNPPTKPAVGEQTTTPAASQSTSKPDVSAPSHSADAGTPEQAAPARVQESSAQTEATHLESVEQTQTRKETVVATEPPATEAEKPQAADVRQQTAASDTRVSEQQPTLHKKIGKNRVGVGEKFDFTIEFQNSTPVDLASVQLTDPIDPRLKLFSDLITVKPNYEHYVSVGNGQVVVRFAKAIKRGKRVRVTIPVMFPVTSAAAAQ